MVIRALSIATAVLLLTGLAYAQGHVATAKAPAGDAVVIHNGKAIPLEPGFRLYQGDVIRTGSDGSVGIMFIDGTRLGVGSGSECSIDDYRFDPVDDQYAFDLFMKRGSAVYSSGRLGKLKHEAVKIRTPRATVGVRGTRFLVKVE